ncbi:WD domain protein [Aspergillus nomiae NRRL 13137]|uniref:WD domain protein n=1 Tax=Aspergillus nomiae NRRL (strain ATCC 15546 / NRRL 13137 / CBS 260.88 / M93) TaxID=1509407 RepID=A0A0L1ISK8_ASPN3|nr:WD domain protein [Aspergillus nomiae NRRL 13137]KNG82561.1 WD domain protein [Aspergillus nomiae NRRL 13137]
MALSFPYILTVSQCNVLSLFSIRAVNENVGHSPVEKIEKPHLLATLKAESILAPMSLSVRVAGSEIISSIVYSFYHIGCGWSIGLQELHFNKSGQQINSRLTTTVDCQYGVTALRPSSRVPEEPQSLLSSDLYGWPTEPSILHREPPTSISYSHPYLLTSHADNTLTVYLVVSTTTSLYVKGGQRLWGHTTSVAAAQVGDHGKAVSVSSRGDEIRIWELEPLISYFGTQRMLEEKSIQVSPENKQCQKYDNFGVLSGVSRCEVNDDQSSSLERSYELDRIRGCVGFDDERVLLLRERNIGNQLLELYDFT